MSVIAAAIMRGTVLPGDVIHDLRPYGGKDGWVFTIPQSVEKYLGHAPLVKIISPYDASDEVVAQ